jgi:hypothetical protein
MSDAGRVPLRPKIIPGPIWQRHRHFLVADQPVEELIPFHVLDTTTGREYPWDVWPPGGKSIGVPTSWACLHRDWTSHEYYVVPAPGRIDQGIEPSARPKGNLLRRAVSWLRIRVL